MSFGAALGAAGRGFAPAFYQGSDFWQKYQQHQLEQEAAKAYGGAMSGMGTPRPGMSGPMSMPSTGTFQPYPMPPAPGVSPQQYGQQPTPPGTPVSQPGGPQPQMPFPRPKPAMPMQQPQAPQQGPMPQQGPSQPQIMPPNSPMPQGPMRDITPRNMSGAGNPGQMQQGGGGQGPFQGMNIQQVIGAIKQHAPGISDEALGMAVDRFMPMLNADAQFQWRTMVDQRAQRQLDERSAWHDRRGDQYDRGLDLKASGQQATNDRFQQREGRLKEREARVNVARLPPEQAAQQKFFGQRFNEMSKAANNAYTNLTRLQSYGGTPEAIGSAQEEYTRYDALRWQAEADYDRFLDTLGGTPAAAPAAPAAKPAAAAPARPSAAAPAKTPIGKGPAGQDLFPVGPQSGRAPDPASDWNGEGSSDVDAPPGGESPKHKLDRDRMQAVRDRDEISPTPAVPQGGRRLSGDELENYATGGKKRLSQMTPEERRAAAAEAKPRTSTSQKVGDREMRRGEIESATPTADDLDRFIAAMEDRRLGNNRTQRNNEVAGNDETWRMYEEDQADTRREKLTTLYKLAHALGIMNDEVPSTDYVGRGKKNSRVDTRGNPRGQGTSGMRLQ